MWSIHTMEYYAALKILTHATACLNLEDIIFSEISQSQKDKYRMIPFYEVLQFSRSVVSDTLRPHEPQHTRPTCPPLTPRAYPNPCPLCWWSYEVLRVVKFMQTESRMVVTWACRGKGWELFFNGWRVLVGEDEKVLEMDFVVVVAKLPWLYFILLNYTL